MIKFKMTNRKGIIDVTIILMVLSIIFIIIGFDIFHSNKSRQNIYIAWITLSVCVCVLSLAGCVYNCVLYHKEGPELPFRIREDLGLQ